MSTGLRVPISTTASELIWARMCNAGNPRHVWFGLGLLSDFGLPIDSLQMFLAAKYMYQNGAAARPVTVLLADTHALSTGVDSATVAKRAAIRAREVQRVARLIDLPMQVVEASSLDNSSDFVQTLRRVLSWSATLEEEPQYYTSRGVADVLYFCQGGGVKVGWTRTAKLTTDRGRHHEYETDALAAQLDDSVAAVYVRHGVTLDSSRPVAVPYTEAKSTLTRLMLTGSDRGNFAAKLLHPNVSDNRRKEMISHLTITVDAFERLVGPLPGVEVLGKATEIVTRVSE